MALSVLFNVVTGGHMNQTTSARNWEWRRRGKFNWVWFVDGLSRQGHCEECWVNWKLIEYTLNKHGMKK